LRKNIQDTEISKQHILAAAEKIFCQYGYIGASMDEIARTTGMTKGAIFWHYDSKLGLFQAVLEKATRRVMEIFAQALTSKEGIMEQCQKIMLGIQGDMAFQVLLQLGSVEEGHGIPKGTLNKVKREVAFIFQDMYKKMEAARKRGELKSDTNTLEVLLTLIMFMSGFAQIEKVKNIIMVDQNLDGKSAIRTVFNGLNSFKRK
jgi:AcrR family transcriptional regulator